MVKVIIEIVLFWTVVVAVLVALWRFVQRYKLTVLICPHCGGKTPMAPSKTDIDCRSCRAPLQRQDHLLPDVNVEVFRLFERSRNAS